MKRFGILLALTAVLTPSPTQAQSTSLPPSARVRLLTTEATSGSQGNGWLVGTIDRQDKDVLWLQLEPSGGLPIAIERSAVRRLEVSNGRTRNPLKGALWGAAAGFGLGLLAVATLDDCAMSTRGWTWDICANNEDFLILGNTMAGAAWGTVIGTLITSERWAPIPRAALVRGPSGRPSRLTLSIRLPH